MLVSLEVFPTGMIRKLVWKKAPPSSTVTRNRKKLWLVEAPQDSLTRMHVSCLFQYIQVNLGRGDDTQCGWCWEGQDDSPDSELCQRILVLFPPLPLSCHSQCQARKQEHGKDRIEVNKIKLDNILDFKIPSLKAQDPSLKCLDRNLRWGWGWNQKQKYIMYLCIYIWSMKTNYTLVF